MVQLAGGTRNAVDRRARERTRRCPRFEAACHRGRAAAATFGGILPSCRQIGIKFARDTEHILSTFFRAEAVRKQLPMPAALPQNEAPPSVPEAAARGTCVGPPHRMADSVSPSSTVRDTGGQTAPASRSTSASTSSTSRSAKVLAPRSRRPRGCQRPQLRWREYGNRVGVWRCLEFRCASACRRGDREHRDLRSLPGVAAGIAAAGDELIAHGHTNAVAQGCWTRAAGTRTASDTAAHAFAGTDRTAPRGWLSPWIAESAVTPDLLAEEGYLYTLNWCHDDQPTRLRRVGKHCGRFRIRRSSTTSR